MFFYLGKNPPITSLQCVAPDVHIDQGWVSVAGAWYKGYSTECNLGESIPAILNGYAPRGKWCVLDGENIYHPARRGFPLYTANSAITNLKIPGAETQPYDDPMPSTDEIISLDDAADLVGNILIENIKNFHKFNDVPMLNVLFTGGLDSLTIWALCDSINVNYSLNVYLPKQTESSLRDYVGFIREYENDLTMKVSGDNWGYDITSLYKNTNWYATGFYAEVSQLRSIQHLNHMANFLGKTVFDLASESDYIYAFLRRPQMLKYKFSSRTFKDERELFEVIYASNTHDYQMWHLDNNMHFSPFFDARLLEVANKLSFADRITNGLNGVIQRKIIEKYNPEFLMLLAQYKNSGDVFKNFRENFEKIRLRPEIAVNIR